MIAIIDYGMGNLRSVQKGFEAVGVEAIVTSDSKKILSARSVVLPGVGAFKACMDNLEKFDLIDTVKRSVQSGKPFLGICLGLQLLFSQAEEFGSVSGLDILKGKVVGFKEAPNSDDPLKIPHMGWNNVVVKPLTHYSIRFLTNPIFISSTLTTLCRKIRPRLLPLRIMESILFPEFITRISTPSSFIRKKASSLD